MGRRKKNQRKTSSVDAEKSFGHEENPETKYCDVSNEMHSLDTESLEGKFGNILKTLVTQNDEKESQQHTDDTTGSCFSCKRQATDLRKCVQCKIALYCDRMCQRAHWPEHKKFCCENKQDGVPTSASAEEKDCPKSASSDQTCFLTHTQWGRPVSEQVPCLYCRIPAEKLMRCMQCKIAKYCDRACQRNHWPQHKDACKRLNFDAYSKTCVRVTEISVYADHIKERVSSDCSLCKKMIPKQNVKKCSKCNIAEYCDERCLTKDLQNHSSSCVNHQKFYKALDEASVLLAKIHRCALTLFVLPPHPFKCSFTPPQITALMVEIVGPYHHFCRHGVYVRDIEGLMVHVLFYHEKEEESALLPYRLENLLSPGNFLRWFYPRWRLFQDFTVGFRIDSLDELEFILKPFTFEFPKFE